MSSNIFGFSGASIGGFDASSALKNYVTLATGQTITGKKVFTADLTSGNLDVGGELTIVDPVNLDTCTVLQNNNDTQIISHTVSGTLQTFQTDESAVEKKTLQLSTTATHMYNKIVRVYESEAESASMTVLKLTANSNSQVENKMVVAKDCVVSSSIADGTANAPLVLTTNSATTCGIRVTALSVLMGAGGTSSNPTSYISVSNGGTATSVGPVPSLTDNSTKIATTAWTKSFVGERQIDLWNNNTSGSGAVYFILEILESAKQFGTMTFYMRSSFYNSMYVRFPAPATYRGMEVVLRWTLPTNVVADWGVTSLNGTDAIFVAGVEQPAYSSYSLGGGSNYVAATWQCDGIYWHLISRV